MELLNIIRILRRWSWLIIAVVVVTSLALFLGLKLARPTYEAQVKLQLSTPQQEEVAVYDQYRTVSARDSITIARNNLQTILESEEIHKRTLRKLNLDPSKVDFQLEISSSADSDYVFISVSATSAKLAASIANTLIDEAVSYYGELRAKPTEAEKELYGQQLQAAEEVYHEAADAFTTFKVKNNVVELTSEITTAQRLLEELAAERDQRLLQVNATDPVSRINGLIDQRKAELNRLLELRPTYLILEQNFQEARERYRLGAEGGSERAYRNAEKAFNDFKAQNNITSLPDEITLQNNLIGQLQQQLDQRLMGDSSEEEINQVNDLIKQHQDELARLLALQPNYNVLEEKTNEAQAKYQHILTKYTEAELKSTVVRAANFIQVIEPAVEPSKPVTNAFQLLILGFMGSLGFGVLLAFLVDYFFGNGEEDILLDNFESRTALGLPILGRIPVLENLVYRIASPEAETIRQVRANILLSPTGASLKTILVTSPQPGDGKTFTASSLGAAMADGKSRTVLVDADMRNPYLHEVFNLPNLGGMADLLSADEDILPQILPQYLRNTNVPGLTLLSAGKLPQDPSLLLSSSNMKCIFEELSKKFDYVIVDSPPFFAAPDSSILSKFVNGVLLVVNPGKTGLKAAQETVHSFSTNGSNILGIVLNRATVLHPAYQYYSRREMRKNWLEKIPALLSFVRAPLDPDLISMEEAARMLGVRRSTVTQWCQNGQLKARRVNLRWWVKRDELRDFLKNRFGERPA